MGSTVSVICPAVRPSALDLHCRGDAWIVASGPGPLALCLGAAPVALIHGSPLDVPALNQLLDRARSRRPRRHVPRRGRFPAPPT
jgi:hypothetical protein